MPNQNQRHKGKQKPNHKKQVLLQSSIQPFTPSTETDSALSSSPFQFSTSISGQLLTLVFKDKQEQHATLSRIEAFYEDSSIDQTYVSLSKAKQKNLCRNYEAFNFPLDVLQKWLQAMKDYKDQDEEDQEGEVRQKKTKGKELKKTVKNPSSSSSNEPRNSGRVLNGVEITDQNEEQKAQNSSEMENSSQSIPSSEEKKENPDNDWWRSKVNLYEAHLLEVLADYNVIDLGSKVPNQEAEKESALPKNEQELKSEDLNQPAGQGDSPESKDGKAFSDNQSKSSLNSTTTTSIDLSKPSNESSTRSPIYLISIVSSNPSTILSLNLFSLFNLNPTSTSTSQSQLAIQHEFLHFIYHTSPSYRSISQSLWSNLTSKSRKIIEMDLKLRGYSEKVFVDEFQAYLTGLGSQNEFGNSKELKEECLDCGDRLREALKEVEKELR